MGLTKIHEIIKKYRRLHETHVENWKSAQKRITDERKYREESYNYMVEGNKLFDDMIKELDGHEVFPKKTKAK